MNTDPVYEILAVGGEKILKLLKPDRYFVALLHSLRETIYYPYIRDGDESPNSERLLMLERPYQGREGLPDRIIAEGKSLFFDMDVTDWKDGADLTGSFGHQKTVSWLGVPMLSGARAFGALVIGKTKSQSAYGENEQRLLETIAQHLALALQNTWLHQREERKIRYLSVLNEIGQKITASVAMDEPEILETIYREASKLPMDMSTMYIAFYDAEQDLVTFPLVYVDGKRVNTQAGEKWRPRRGDHRRTETVIKEKRSILIQTREQAKKWYLEIGWNYDEEETFASWIGAPMLAGDLSVGMIAVRHVDEYQYDQDDLQVLEILASQAAVTIQNCRLIKQANSAEKLAMMSEISAEFVHRMNNLAGTIPARAGQLRRKIERLDEQQVRELKITRDLDAIDTDARQILDAAWSIKEATTTSSYHEQIDLEEAIQISLGRALSSLTVSEDSIKVLKDVQPNVPPVIANRYKFLDVLTNIIKNGMDAMVPKGGGSLVIRVCMDKVRGRPAVKITVEDTGEGISDDNLTRIFDLFFTTKPGGTGFGLWRDRFTIRALGGEIRVKSMVNVGSVFTILVPVDVPLAEDKN
jgi:signal transduction histidine kinase